MTRNFLVTGGCGFIGSNFIHLVLAGNEDCKLTNLDKLTYAGNPKNLQEVEHDPRYRFIKGDICDFKLLEDIFIKEKIDTVVHFAAESHVDRSIHGPADFIQTNIVGTFTLLETARKIWRPGRTNKHDGKYRFLHVSTDEVYGSLGQSGAFTETTAYDPRSPYSASKASSDHLVNAYFHTYNLPVLITNCSNNYGPYQFPEKLIPLTLINALKGERIPVYGDGKNVRDWLYVKDHCEAILALLAGGRLGETYNIGGNNEKQNIEVVEAVCDILDRKTGLLENNRPRRSLITFVKDRPGHDRRYAINAGKLKRELDWSPKVEFTEGLEQTIAWYLANREWVESVVDGTYKKYYHTMYQDRLS